MTSIFSTKTRLLILTALAVLSAFRAEGAATYCAFEVVVRTPFGMPASKVGAAMIRRDHTTSLFDTTTDAGGVARFCDAPLEGVDIVVGDDLCGSVLVRSVKPTWPETHRLFVTYVKTFCDHFAMGPECMVLLRVQDENGRALVGARFKGRPTSGPASPASDSLGRLFLSLEKRERLEGSVSHEGRQPARLSMECVDDLELKVTLHK